MESIILAESTIIHSHATGNQNSRQAAKAFAETGALLAFCTAISVESGSLLPRILPAIVRRELARRDFSETAGSARTFSVAPIRELTRFIAQKFNIKKLIEHEKGWACVDELYICVDRKVARKLRAHSSSVSAVYAYEDGAYEIFKTAKELGIPRIYELPIGYWRTHRRLCEEEAHLKPEWAHTWHASEDSESKLARKDAELALANHIVVPSRFVADSLQEYPGELPPISVIPYGCPEPIDPDTRHWYSGGVLKILYVGGISQRKGLSYLLDAVKTLGDSVELTVIGSGSGKDLLKSASRVLGSVPHSVVLEEMRCHDIFVFPTLFEGYSLAIAEALANGLPVITTLNSGVGDIISDGKEGWIVPLRDSESIRTLLESCLDSPQIIKMMGLAALSLAKDNSWVQYRKALSSICVG